MFNKKGGGRKAQCPVCRKRNVSVGRSGNLSAHIHATVGVYCPGGGRKVMKAEGNDK